MIHDVTGELVQVRDLVERLTYRQDKRRRTGLKPDETLNISICYGFHARQGRSLKACDICGASVGWLVVRGELRKP